MNLSDITIIYLAAGAPFGVHYFFNGQQTQTRRHTILKATAMMLLWPLAATLNLKARWRIKRQSVNVAMMPDDARASSKLELAQSDFLNALSQIQQCAQEATPSEREKMERAAWLVRGSFEKYLCLTMAAATQNSDDRPDAREMELCRIANRTGDDLLLAGRCVHRRNAARLNEHAGRARNELLHALAELRESQTDSRPHAAALTRGATIRLSESLLKTFSHAINLFSLLEDERATLSVARLLDAECARLRRLQADDSEEAQRHRNAFGEETCSTHAPLSILTNPSPSNTPMPQT